MSPQEELAARFRFGTKDHETLTNALHKRVKLSSDALRDRFTQMGKNEEQFRAFIPEQEADKIRRNKRENLGMPAFTTIEIPYSYAQLLTAHTYYTSVFLSRTPVMQFQGRHGEGQQKEQCVESLMDYQLNVGAMLVPMYIWLLDVGKYGYSIVGHYWDKKEITVRTRVDEPVKFLGFDTGKTQSVDKVEKVTAYEGNKLYNVRPQDFFPDTRVPMNQFQRGEFCARYIELPWHEVMQGQKSGKYFNIDEIKKSENTSSFNSGSDIQRDTGSSNVSDLPSQNSSNQANITNTGILKGHEIYVRLVPRDWKLSNSNDYEIWVFTRTDKGVVIGADPMGNYHGEFPFDFMEYEPTGYNLTSVSMMETIKPLNDVMSWLVNTHFYNVRAALNNQFIFDPSMVVQSDLENPKPGKLLRVKPAAYGRDVRTMISQLPVQDMTRSNISDLHLIADMIQRTNGINDNLMGMLDSGGRKTATEVRSSSSFGINRMKTNCEYFSAMGFSPLAMKLLQNTQQFYSAEKQYRLVGNLAEMSPGFVNITADEIAGFYDFVPVDGTMPIDRFAQANLWQMLLGQMQHFPQLMTSYDIPKIFGWIAGLGGLKNVSQFRVQVVPDDRMQNQEQSGNSIPMQGGNLPQLTEPGQIPGMGQTT